MGHPMKIETTTQTASMRQIHAAIEHIERQDYECAITLAAAAEGMLPPTDNPYFHQKVKEMAKKLSEVEGAAHDPNDVITWLKHGTLNGKKINSATIEVQEAVAITWRAISKFWAVYQDASPQMKAFKETAIRIVHENG